MDDVTRFRTAQRLVDSGDPHAAMQVLGPLLTADGGMAPTSVLLLAGRASFATASLDRAEHLFRQVVESDPSDHYAHAALGRTLIRRSRHREAVTHLRLATALSPESWYLEALRAAERAVGSAATDG